MIRQLSFLFLLLPYSVFPDSVVDGLYVAHYKGTKALWDARMGNYTVDELDSFVKATWQGTYGNVKVVEALSAISILECGDKRDVRDRTGHLGGHRRTMRKGAKECKIALDTPFDRTEALSRHFLVLYYHYNQNLERTCRVWNKGQKYMCPLATRYWNGVIQFSKIYDNGKMRVPLR